MVTIDQIDFSKLKPYNGKVTKCFEQLCYQIAQNEYGHLGKFTPIDGSGGDGGVEFFLNLTNGEKWGWQCKFFGDNGRLNISSRDKSIELSLKTACRNHTDLTKWFLCLKTDLTNESISPKGKFSKGERNWFNKELPKNIPPVRKILLEHWGETSFITFLKDSKHSGIRSFFFGELELNQDWFKTKLDIAISDLGKRYTPELNYDLEIAKIFEGLVRSEKYKNGLKDSFENMMTENSKMELSLNHNLFKRFKNKLHSKSRKLLKEYNGIVWNDDKNIPFDKLEAICIEILDLIEKIDNSYLKKNEILISKINNLHNKKTKSYKSISDLAEGSLINVDKNKTKDDEKIIGEKLKKLNIDKDFYNNRTRDLFNSRSAIYEFRNFITNKASKLCNLPVLIINGEWGKGKSHLVADIAQKRMLENKPSLVLLGQQFLTKEDPWSQILKKLQIDYTADEFLDYLNYKAKINGSKILIFIDAINEGEGKSIWSKSINGFIKSFDKYKWLGLVLTIRNSYINILIPSDRITENEAIRVEHLGFEGVEYEASKLFFSNYNIELPSIPFLVPEFSTPLFLKLFCEAIEKSGFKKIPDGLKGISSIFNLYINSVNISLSERLEYPSEINLVKEASDLIVEYRISNSKKILDYREIFDLLEPLLSKYSNKRGFLFELINEGFLSKNLYWDSADPFEYVYFSYERLDNHLTASYLINKLIDKKKPALTFNSGGKLHHIISDRYKAFSNQGLVESLSILIPELLQIDFYEIIPEECKSFPSIIKSFLNSLLWRKSDTMSSNLLKYINKYINKNNSRDFIDTILTVTTIPKNYFNAVFLHKQLMRFKLADRDAWWIPYLHDRYIDDNNPIKRLIDWGWNSDDKSHFSDDSIKLAANTLSWFLASTNRNLRDSATKSLVSLLTNRINILIDLLKNFNDVNDPYIAERLYCVAYGCVLRTKQLNSLNQLSLYIYENIFNKEYVYPHILLRDYAREIIEFTFYKGIKLKIKEDKIRPPYKSTFPKRLPSNNQIDKYRFNHDMNGFKDYYWSQNSILSSMVTEYGGSMYGDFGRYIFESGFKNWKDIKAQKLSNLAVKKIFSELGYDVEKHGKFDRDVKGYNYDRHYLLEERIGKKYQWIVFHELLARVSDNFKMYERWSYNDTIIKYNGPWEPNLRDIDPSIIIKNTKSDYYSNNEYNWWFNVNYSDWKAKDNEWVHSISDLPKPPKIINIRDNKNSEWLMLQAYPHWDEPKKIGENLVDRFHRSIWYHIRSYLIKDKDYSKFILWSKKQNFWGRWMPEARERYELFHREFYWSPGYNDFFKDYYKNNDWVSIEKRDDEKSICETNVPVEEYIWGESYDFSKDSSIRLLFPSNLIFKKMGLDFDVKEGHFLDNKGNLICFNPDVEQKGLSCLLIRKKPFLKFLKKNKLKIVWVVIGEKQETGGGINSEFTEFSGIYTLDTKNNLKGKFKLNSDIID